ncbi:MAG: hypothetical protein WBM04_09820 [Candidatus Korobacteraceae bacterium]
MPATYLPKHYRAVTAQISRSGESLDPLYEQGWRVVSMALHPDGKQITVLLEKQLPTPS